MSKIDVTLAPAHDLIMDNGKIQAVYWTISQHTGAATSRGAGKSWWQVSVYSKPTRCACSSAGPFETRDDAQSWLDKNCSLRADLRGSK